MSGADDFLTRWSRRKRAASEHSAGAADDTQAQARDAGRPVAQSGDVQAAQTEAAAEPFDLAKLPPLDSITADTDIRAFFAPGVPADLTREALRRAWVTDPKIRDFVGLSENAWDFNSPDAVPGFGPLEMTEDLRRQIGRMVGGFLQPEEDPAATEIGSADPASSETAPQASTSEASGGPLPASSAPVDSVVRPDQVPDSAVTTHRTRDYVASQQQQASREDLQVSAKRSHGRALPK